MTQEEINNIISNENCKNLIESKEFYFQKGQDALNKWLNLSVNDSLKAQLIELGEDYEKLKQVHKSSSELKEIIDLLFEITSYSDVHANEKDKYNKYDDKRTIAKAGVRMGNWMAGLIKFKFKHEPITGGSIINAFNYLLDPQNNTTILSENHRAAIAANLFKKEYDPKTFVTDLKNYYSQYNIQATNPDNYTQILSVLIYEMGKEWKDEVVGLMASDGTKWQDDYIEEIKDYDACIIWNSKRPSGTTNTIKFLKNIISEGESFPLFYSIGGFANYKAEIIDFAESQEHLDKKQWDKKHKTLYYNNNFADYKDNKKAARIVFLAKSISKIDPIAVDDFEFYDGYDAPRQDNLSPIKEIPKTEINAENKLFSSNQFNAEDFEAYIKYLREIVTQFNLKQGDERLVFSTRDNNLNFLIGQRYCWNLFVANKDGKFGVIATDKLKENSGRFDGTDPAPYYTHFDDINSVYENSESIYSSLELELKRTKKSSFRKFNNIDFEKYVFNVTQHLNKMNYKEEYTTWLNRTNPNDGGTKSSYVRAIEILSTIVKYNIFEVDNLNEIDFLYGDLIKEQRIEGGKYYHKEATSYGNKGFYSAAIKTYSDFLKQYKKPNTITFMEPLNTILFGPPGTGKTYNSINKAISIVNLGFNTKQDRKLVKEEYDRLEKDNRILFSTFHQSMSYEDFIEGIKPLPPKPNEPLNYDIQAGIFKIACARAAYLCYKKYNQAKGVDKSNYTFDDLYNAFIESIKPSIKNNQFPIYKTITGKDVEIYEVNSQDSIKARAKGSKATHVAPLTQENLEKLYNKYNSASEIKNLDEIRDTVQVSPRSTEFYAVFDGLKHFEKTYKPDNTIIEEDVVVDTTEDAEKIKKFTAGIYNDAIKQFGKEAEPIVLIIDEINRGNVSQIFGELITLIEDDKRIGKSESLEVILPYSKCKFGVPPNLHLVGTMNTADRSVEALDTALRRRFVFEEIPPKYDLKELQYEYAGVKAFEILQTINKRIEKLLDKDHLIGHSYFILKDGEKPNEKLKNSFYKSILPLLQEYFFGDFGKIGLVLGQGFVNIKNWDDKVDSFAEFDHESSGDFESKDVYEIIDYREPTTFEVNKVKMDFEKAIKRLMKLNIA